MSGNGRKPPARQTIDLADLGRMLTRFDVSRVTLCSRTPLDGSVTELVREFVCSAAGREIALDLVVSPTMDAGAVLIVGDAARVVLDPRAMWLSSVEQQVRQAFDEGDEAPGAEDAFEHLRSLLSTTAPSAGIEELLDTGSVVRVGDGVRDRDRTAGRGLPGDRRVRGRHARPGVLAQGDQVGVALLGTEEDVREGSDVRRTGLCCGCRRARRARPRDRLAGSPIDGKGPIVPGACMPAERMAPGVVDRQPVDVPLHTGMKAIDALVPLGRGQRELIIGDRKIGKTTMAVDTILAQKGHDVACVYCGDRAEGLDGRAGGGARSSGTVRWSTPPWSWRLPGEPPAFRYLAPYTACALGEYFMDRGSDALVVYDDLTKHATTYREMSALLDRPVGREAYPGDIFYVHSRLLERAARLSDERGGGSLTAMPIVETLAGDISAFIPTNVISICDGQIMLDSAAFNEGRRPALDAGLSVSRVGGSAQTKVMKQVAGRLRIDLAQYDEMARS